MQFKIENSPVFTTLTVNMSSGETFRSEAGAMISMSSNIDLKAKTTGKGVMGMLKSSISGESLFTSEYTAEGDGNLVVAPGVPGDIIQIELNGNMLLLQSGAYLAGSADLEIGTRGSLKAMFSGEDLFLQTVRGNGTVFANSYGSVMERTLDPGETYIVDTGHIVAFEETVTYKIRKAAGRKGGLLSGVFSSFASGEGLVCEYTGPGKIWIQSRNLGALASALTPFLPKK